MCAEEHTQNAPDVPDDDHIRDFSGAPESQGLPTVIKNWEKQAVPKILLFLLDPVSGGS